MIESNVCVNYATCIGNGGKVLTLMDGTVSCAFCSETKEFNTQS